jgi:hypothetical protein
MSQNKIGSWEIYTKGFGSKILMKFGWQKGQPIGKHSNGVIAPLFEINGKFDQKPVKILKQIKSLRDEKRFHLMNEIDKLLDTNEEADAITTTSLPSRLEYFRLINGPLLKELSNLTLVEVESEHNAKIIPLKPQKQKR